MKKPLVRARSGQSLMDKLEEKSTGVKVFIRNVYLFQGPRHFSISLALRIHTKSRLYFSFDSFRRNLYYSVHTA